MNAMIIKDLPFDAVQGRLAAAGWGDALFWNTVRGNSVVIEDAKLWWDICVTRLNR